VKNQNSKDPSKKKYVEAVGPIFSLYGQFKKKLLEDQK